MSPEQARGQVVDRRTDIWAFGCVLFEMLTGRRAFGGATVTDTLAAVLEREPAWDTLPTGTPTAIVRLLRRCLTRERRLRLHDIADARIELEAALQEPGGEPVPRLMPESRRAWRFAVVGLLGIALGIAVAQILPSRTNPDSTARDDPASLPTLRLVIDLPASAPLAIGEASAVGSAGPVVALSPDATRLVYVG